MSTVQPKKSSDDDADQSFKFVVLESLILRLEAVNEQQAEQTKEILLKIEKLLTLFSKTISENHSEPTHLYLFLRDTTFNRNYIRVTYDGLDVIEYRYYGNSTATDGKVVCLPEIGNLLKLQLKLMLLHGPELQVDDFISRLRQINVDLHQFDASIHPPDMYKPPAFRRPLRHEELEIKSRMSTREASLGDRD